MHPIGVEDNFAFSEPFRTASCSVAAAVFRTNPGAVECGIAHEGSRCERLGEGEMTQGCDWNVPPSGTSTYAVERMFLMVATVMCCGGAPEGRRRDKDSSGELVDLSWQRAKLRRQQW
jgi:hypothetical protein